jgi:hypothetical protein
MVWGSRIKAGAFRRAFGNPKDADAYEAYVLNPLITLAWSDQSGRFSDSFRISASGAARR